MAKLTVSELLPPKFSPPKVTPPVTVLRQLAALLGERTGGAVLGEVLVQTSASSELNTTPRPFLIRFNLQVPALSGYQFPLFQVESSADVYPVRLRSRYFAELGQDPKVDDSDRVFLYCLKKPDTDQLICDCPREDDFFRLLHLLFFSEAAAHLIGSLMAQTPTQEPLPEPETEAPAPEKVATTRSRKRQKPESTGA